MGRKHSRWICLDCQADTSSAGLGEHYFVHAAVWLAVASERGMLCVGCLETRLGRRLNARDFPDVHVNRPARGVFRSARLCERMSA